MHAISQKGIALNRKALADLALNNPETFQTIVRTAMN
jgi:ribosomal protein L20